MAPATRTTTSLASGITQTTIVSALLTAFSNAGYSSPVDNYTSGSDKVLVYALTYDASKTYGTVYYKIRISSGIAIYFQVLSSWNAVSHTGSNGSTDSLISTLTTTSTIVFDSLNASSEYKLVVVTQSGVSFLLGLIFPSSKPSWWDVNSFPYGFAFSTTTINAMVGSSLSPYSNQNYSTLLNTTFMGSANLQTNRRDVLTGIVIFSNANRGVACKTSDDLAIAAASGNSRFDILTFPGSTNEYLIINNVPGGLAVRTA